MLEVTFSESAAGAMACAIAGDAPSHLLAVDATAGPGDAPPGPHTAAQRCEHAHPAKQGALPLSGSRADILCFPLALSLGSIAEVGIGPGREQALAQLMCIYPASVRTAAGQMLQTARTSLTALLERARAGEPVRIWASPVPDDACGLCWLMQQLEPLGFSRLTVHLVDLPAFDPRPDGTVAQYTGWGEVDPHCFARLASAGRPLSTAMMHAMALHWARLQQQDAPLRAQVNGQLVGVPASFYDPFILSELPAPGQAFDQATVVGRVLGRYALGISDALIALRMQSMLHDGLLEVVSPPAPDAPIYHRTLRRCPAAQ